MIDNLSNAANKASLGTVALLAAFLTVLLQAIAGVAAEPWANMLALIFAITGVGLRLEAAIARRER